MTGQILSWLFCIPALGAMTGLRSMTPMALLCFFAWRGRLDVGGTWAFWTANPITVAVFVLLALGEYFGDKLPQTPNRTKLFALGARLAFGALVGAVCAMQRDGPEIEGAILGGACAVFAAFVGLHFRLLLTKRKGLPDTPVGLLEDALTIGASTLALLIVGG